MNDREIQEIQQLPHKYKPMGAWSYFGYNILFNIPIIGLIFAIVFAVDDSNIIRRSYARSFFCVYAVIIVVSIIVGVLVGVGVIAGFAAGSGVGA